MPGRSTFAAGARLRKRAEYQRVYREGRSRRHTHVVLYHADSQSGPEAPARFGITVSRQVSKGAVMRNRVRRVWREAARLARPQFKTGVDIVLNARAASAQGLNVHQAEEILLTLARQENLLHG